MSRYRVVITVELESEDEADAACEAVQLAKGIVEDDFETSSAEINVWSTMISPPTRGQHWSWWQYKPNEPDSSWGTSVLAQDGAVVTYAGPCPYLSCTLDHPHRHFVCKSCRWLCLDDGRCPRCYMERHGGQKMPVSGSRRIA